MKKMKQSFFRILRIELDDLKTDIKDLIEHSEQEKNSGSLTGNVFLENIGIFQKEILGVDLFFRIMDNTDIDDYETLDDLLTYLKQEFSREIKERGIVPAIELYVNRKIDKVAEYVRH